MRTLAEMATDISRIESSVNFLQGIADQERSFTPLDIHVFNCNLIATKQNIEKLQQFLEEAYSAVNDHTTELTEDVKANETDRRYATEQLADAISVSNSLNELSDQLNLQIDKFNACQETARSHP